MVLVPRLFLSHYIPVGCIGVSRADVEVEDSTWQSSGGVWKDFVHPDRLLTNSEPVGIEFNPMLDPLLQTALLKSPSLRRCARLFSEYWVQLKFKAGCPDSGAGSIRIYLLPDDVLRGSVARGQANLIKARGYVLAQIDCSIAAWTGQEMPSTSKTELLTEYVVQDDQSSLLTLFNNIPSPEPTVLAIADPFLQKAASAILQGQIPGLKTKLLQYQRRSIAFMMQKEVNPGQNLDPRLLRLQDRDGLPWYLDPVATSVYREPKYYDGVSGGILAEEMGTGKTIICLALILATRHFPSEAPEFFWSHAVPVREAVGSLMDMAAACVTRYSQPWKSYYEYTRQASYDGTALAEAIRRNPGSYFFHGVEPLRCGRTGSNYVAKPKKILLSKASLVVVPNNLLLQWKQEISKHTETLQVLVLGKKDVIPSVQILLEQDVILFSQSRFELLVKTKSIYDSPLCSVHFKRCIVDEGHILGNSKLNAKSLLLLGLDSLHFSSRWIVTGTPSRGLYGIGYTSSDELIGEETASTKADQSSKKMERGDIEHLGSIAALYLKARPWANSSLEVVDTLAKWTKHTVPRHNGRGRAGRWECLKSTVDSLIIRHRINEIVDQLPPVDERTVLLEGSYQDTLSLNLFTMMIIFNSVQSQRTDVDYFFHAKQRKSLLQIVHNLKQSSFFGGSFFSAEEIAKSIKTAQEFLEKEKVPISMDDEELLQTAIDFGQVAVASRLRNLSNQFHEMPIGVRGFPGSAGKCWSLDGEASDETCTSASMILALQRLLYKAAGTPEELNSLLNGGLMQAGLLEREKVQVEAELAGAKRKREQKSGTLAGNTKLGDDVAKKTRTNEVIGVQVAPSPVDNETLSSILEETKLVSTVSAKLSYLIDSITQHQEEKMIIFYENENVAWYLASILDVLQIQNLIYAKGLAVERRGQYVSTFHHNPTFRVLLMDLSQAAFGLDIRVASRVYFINPVLNRQVESQAIARVRRISQERAVSVETLVLRNSIDEVILAGREHMTQAEHGKAKTVLDVASIKDWIRNARIVPMGDAGNDHAAQMARLKRPAAIFGHGFGRVAGTDEGLVREEVVGGQTTAVSVVLDRGGRQKRARDEEDAQVGSRRVRFDVDVG